MLTKTDIHEFLKSIGIKPNDTVLVHTSMKSLGEVEGGCDGLIDGFTSYLTDGLFVVPTHTWLVVNKENPVFDVRKTVPNIGALPTVAAFRKDGVRSLHPTHSVAAFGKRAAEFVKGEEKCGSPAAIGGVWNRLLDEKAKILLLGVAQNRNTFIHAVDEMIDLPYRLGEAYEVTIIGYNGEKYTHPYRPHGKTGSLWFGVYETPFVKCGALTFAKLGEATVGVFDTVRGTEVIKLLWKNAEYDLTLEAEQENSYEPRKIPESYFKELMI